VGRSRPQTTINLADIAKQIETLDEDDDEIRRKYEKRWDFTLSFSGQLPAK